jgi:cell division protein FtsA
MIMRRTPANEILIATDLGTQKMTVAVAEMAADGSLTLLGVGESASAGMRKAEVTDFNHARAAARMALAEAERRTQAEISEVYLTLSGTHLSSRNESVRVATLSEDENRVTEDTLEELNKLASNLQLNRDHAILHELLRGYSLDRGVASNHPLGVHTEQIEAHYHLVSGKRTRLQTAVQCVADQKIRVKGCTFSGYASGLAVLGEEARNRGTVVVDMGAGVTDVTVWRDDAVVHSAVHGVGGDHLSQDLSIGLEIPYARAEKLKRECGGLVLDPAERDEMINLAREISFDGKTFYKEAMVQILQARTAEILELIRDDLEQQNLWGAVETDVVITGGGARMRGLARLASEILPRPVRIGRARDFLGEQGDLERPELATVLGTLRYAAECERRDAGQTQGWRKIQKSLGRMVSAMRFLA